MSRIDEDEVKNRIVHSVALSFFLGTLFTVTACIAAFHGRYIYLAALIPLGIWSIWKACKEGECSSDEAFFAISAVFFSIPVICYMMYRLICLKSYFYPVICGLIYLPGILSGVARFFKDMRGE